MFRCRLMISPDDFGWAPGAEPPPVLFDPSISQSFMMLDNTFTFGEDGFLGYATGRTFPVKTNGRHQLLAGAVGNIMEGFGKFKGLEGTYLFNGIITPAFGLLGSITLRVLDWDGNLRADGEIASLTPVSNPDPETTYIVLHGQKKVRLKEPNTSSGRMARYKDSTRQRSGGRLSIASRIKGGASKRCRSEADHRKSGSRDKG